MGETGSQMTNKDKLLALGPVAAAKAYQNILEKIKAGKILKPSEIKSKGLLEQRLQAPPEAKEESGPPGGTGTRGDLGIVSSLAEVAAHFGKSLRQVQRWRQKGMPCLSGGRFDLLLIQSWLDQRQGVRGPGRPGPEEKKQWNLPPESGKDFWDKEGKKWQAQQRELDYRQRKGELVERKEVEALFVARVLEVTQGLEGLSRSLPPQLIHCRDEREMQVIISREVRALRERYARPLPKSLGEGSPKESPEG